MDLEWCKNCDKGLPAPDVVIYLDIPVDEAALRGSYGEERYERIDFQSKVRERFMNLKNEDENVIPWHSLDARKSIEELQSEIQEIVGNILTTSGDKPIAKLWM